MCAFISPKIDSVEWTIPFLFYIVHRLMISLKYGSLHDTEYKCLLYCQEPSVAQEVDDNKNELETSFTLLTTYLILSM